MVINQNFYQAVQLIPTVYLTAHKLIYVYTTIKGQKSEITQLNLFIYLSDYSVASQEFFQ